jgi:hypothetical protein
LFSWNGYCSLTADSTRRLEHFPLEMLAGEQSSPASISLQGFARKSLPSSPTFQS